MAKLIDPRDLLELSKEIEAEALLKEREADESLNDYQKLRFMGQANGLRQAAVIVLQFAVDRRQ